MITEDWWYVTEGKSEILGEIALTTITMYPPQILHGIPDSEASGRHPTASHRARTCWKRKARQDGAGQ